MKKAGPYPVSEPEVRNLVDALVARPNVCAYFAYHTYSAVNLRPYDDRPDEKMPAAASLQSPEQLTLKGRRLPAILEVRGEVYMPLPAFADLLVNG